MDSKEEMLRACEHYTKCGIITHPLIPPVLGDRRTGKSPLPLKWQSKKEPYHPKYMEQEINKGCNLGILCGKESDITVVDIDWARKGISDMLFSGMDTSKWVTQRHGDGKKYHIIFKYCPGIMPGLNQDLGFDVLTRNNLGGGANCVCAPSVHSDGTKYVLSADISQRTAMPLELADRINNLVSVYGDLQEVLTRCRAVWRKFWRAIFTDKQHELYHYTQVFHGQDGRRRHLGLFAELKSNGATDEMLLLACALIFGDRFDYDFCLKELRQVKCKPMKNETIIEDEYLTLFYVPKGFDPYTAQVTELEKKLVEAEAVEAYEKVLTNTTNETFEAVQRAFLVGYFIK